MAINQLFIMNGIDYTPEILTPFKVSRAKLWAEDSGRVMSGEVQGSLIGIFPKISVVFYAKTQAKLSEIMTVLDSPTQNIQYYDSKTQTMKSMSTYTGDYDVNIVNLSPYHSEISVSFISRRKE